MSKKSRKRNKKILAAIGIGLGAAALASRKPKQSDVSQDSGRGSGLRDTVDTKKTTAKKDKKNIPQDTKVNTGKKETNKKTTIKPFKAFDVSVPEGSTPLKLQDNSIRAKNRQTSSTGIKEPNKPMMASLFPKSQTADNYKADMQDFGRTNQYKSGGRVKGCGKALRGFGKAMKGKR
jgi:hypothetical protein